MWGFMNVQRRVHEHLQSNDGMFHASEEWLEPLDIQSLCLLGDGLQNTLVTATKREVMHII